MLQLSFVVPMTIQNGREMNGGLQILPTKPISMLCNDHSLLQIIMNKVTNISKDKLNLVLFIPYNK